MTVYQHRATVTAASGATSTATLRVRGGILRQMFIVANTDTTVFRSNLVDEASLTVQNWGFHTGMLNDNAISMPAQGTYTLNITNASPDDTFKILIGVEE